MDSVDSIKASRDVCVHCKKASTKVCKGCQDSPGNAGRKTAYCDVICQRADWPRHKRECKRLQQRKALYRAADLLQSTWYMYQEMAQITPVEKIEVENNVVSVYDGDLTAVARRGEGPFFIFPEGLVTDQRNREAAITAHTCNEAMRNLYAFAEALFVDITARVQECFFKVKSPPRRVVLIRYEGPRDETDYVHVVWKAVSRSREAYAIDPAGAQYGWYESIIPWDQFLQTRVQYIQHFDPFGFHNQRPFDVGPRLLTHSESVFLKLVAEAGREFQKCVAAWVARNNRALSEVLKLPDVEFDIVRANFFKFVREDFGQRLVTLSRLYGLRLDKQGQHEYYEAP